MYILYITKWSALNIYSVANNVTNNFSYCYI